MICFIILSIVCVVHANFTVVTDDAIVNKFKLNTKDLYKHDSNFIYCHSNTTFNRMVCLFDSIQTVCSGCLNKEIQLTHREYNTIKTMTPVIDPTIEIPIDTPYYYPIISELKYSYSYNISNRTVFCLNYVRGITSCVVSAVWVVCTSCRSFVPRVDVTSPKDIIYYPDYDSSASDYRSFTEISIESHDDWSKYHNCYVDTHRPKLNDTYKGRWIAYRGRMSFNNIDRYAQHHEPSYLNIDSREVTSYPKLLNYLTSNISDIRRYIYYLIMHYRKYYFTFKEVDAHIHLMTKFSFRLDKKYFIKEIHTYFNEMLLRNDNKVIVRHFITTIYDALYFNYGSQDKNKEFTASDEFKQIYCSSLFQNVTNTVRRKRQLGWSPKSNILKLPHGDLNVSRTIFAFSFDSSVGMLLTEPGEDDDLLNLIHVILRATKYYSTTHYFIANEAFYVTIGPYVAKYIINYFFNFCIDSSNYGKKLIDSLRNGLTDYGDKGYFFNSFPEVKDVLHLASDSKRLNLLVTLKNTYRSDLRCK